MRKNFPILSLLVLNFAFGSVRVLHNTKEFLVINKMPEGELISDQENRKESTDESGNENIFHNINRMVVSEDSSGNQNTNSLMLFGDLSYSGYNQDYENYKTQKTLFFTVDQNGNSQTQLISSEEIEFEVNGPATIWINGVGGKTFDNYPRSQDLNLLDPEKDKMLFEYIWDPDHRAGRAEDHLIFHEGYRILIRKRTFNWFISILPKAENKKVVFRLFLESDFSGTWKKTISGSYNLSFYEDLWISGAYYDPYGAYWKIYPLFESNVVYTFDWMGWINVEFDPYIWSSSLKNWIYLSEEGSISNKGGWIYVFR